MKAPIDAKSNFMLLMSLMDLNPNDMAPGLGTDATLISRWRTGKRRLVPGKPWVKKVAEYFVRHDGEQAEPVLPLLMRTLYPTKPCDTEEQRLAAVTQFLVCPGQMEYAYRMRRYELLKDVMPERLAEPKNPADEVDHIGVWTHGKQRLLGSMMEYLGMVDKQSEEHVRMIAIGAEGLNPILAVDHVFAQKFMERLFALFRKGHRLTLIVHPDYAPEGSEQFLARLESLHLRGCIDTHFCTEFEKRNAFPQTLLLTIKHGFCVSATIPEGDPTQARILTVHSPVTAAKAHFMGLKMRRDCEEAHEHGLYSIPGDFYRGTRARAAQMFGPLYYLSDVPYFCALNAQGMRDAYRLTEEEAAWLESELELLTVRPQDVHGAPMRWVICRDEIERALMTGGVEAPEMSAIFDRDIWLTRLGLVAILRGLLVALGTSMWFEVALVPRYVMEKIGVRALIMDSTLALGMGEDGLSTGTGVAEHVEWAMNFADMVWKRIPPGMKSAAMVKRVVNGLVATYDYPEEEPSEPEPAPRSDQVPPEEA